MKKACIALFSLAMMGTIYAQNKQSLGRVLNEQNSAPIAGASVEIGSTKILTDDRGNFNFECVAGLQIKVSAFDFLEKTVKVENCNEVLLVTLVPKLIKQLEEVEITATSGKKDVLYQPISIEKLSNKELKRGTGLFLDDAINTNVPGVFMQRRTVSAGQSFNIRGYGNGIRGTNGLSSNFDGQGSKVYLNGIPLTDAEGITLMDDIDFSSIGEVEVLKGPAGTLYGLAIAGVVNMNTVRPEAGKTTIGQEMMLGSYGLERYTTSLHMGTAKSSFILNYGRQRFDGFMPHTESTKEFVNVAGTFDVNEKEHVSYYAGYSNSFDQRNGELTVEQYNTLDYSGNPAYIKNAAHSNVISYRAGVNHTYKLTKYVSNSTSFFGSGIASNVSSAGGWTDKLPLNYGLRSTLDYKRTFRENVTLSGVTGVEAQRQHSQVMAYNMVVDSFDVDGYNIIGSMRSNTYTVSSTYSYFTDWTLSMPHDVSITTGLGVSNMSLQLNDRFYVSSNNNPSNPNGTNKPSVYQASYNYLLSPHIALNKVFNKKVSLYASFGTGHKAPVSSYFYIPLLGQVNTGLIPEFGQQFEIGSKGSLMKGKLHYEVAAFQALFKNKMTVVAVPNTANTATSYTYVRNGGTQNHLGLEALIKYTILSSDKGFIKQLTPFMNAAYSHFKYEDFKFQRLNSSKDSILESDFSGKVVAGVPPLTFNAGFDLYTNFGFYLNATYNYRDSVYFTSDNLNRAPGFGLLNAKIGYERTFFKHLNTSLYFGINNITSVQYYQMLFVNQLPDSFLPGPNEANFFGGVSLKYAL